MPKPPLFDIHIAENSRDTVIFCNGQDITKAVQVVKIIQTAGQPPKVTLKIVPGEGQAILHGAIETLTVFVLPDITPTASFNPNPDAHKAP